MLHKTVSPICLDNDDYSKELNFILIHGYLYVKTQTKYGTAITLFKEQVDAPQKILYGTRINGELCRFALAKNRSQNINNPTYNNKTKELLLNTRNNSNQQYFAVNMTEINEDDIQALTEFQTDNLINIPIDILDEWRKYASSTDVRTKIKEATLYDHYMHVKKVNAEHIYDHSLNKEHLQALTKQYPLTLDRIFLDVISNKSQNIKSFFTDFYHNIIYDTKYYITHINYNRQLELPTKSFKDYYPLQTFYAEYIDPVHSNMNTMDYSFIIHKNQVFLQDILIGTLEQHFPYTIITRFYSRNIPTLHKQKKSKHHEPYILITPYIMHYTHRQIKVHVIIHTPEQKHNSPYNLYKSVNTYLFDEHTFKDHTVQQLKYDDIFYVSNYNRR